MLSILTTELKKKTKKQEDIINLLGVMSMFITLIVAMVLYVYSYVQIHQNVYIKYMQLLYTKCLNRDERNKQQNELMHSINMLLWGRH